VTDAVPKILGRYEIQEEIGRGMMGVVYRALDPALGRTVALKTVRLSFSIPEGEREVFEKRFLAEARIAAGLSHPGIVVVHDVGRDEQSATLFIALEYLQGRSLSQLIADGGPMDWREALRLTARIAHALHHAHAQGIVHRDIKPANIMVLPSGDPKIMDFGIAKVPTSQLTGAGEFFGTPLYMSPEQARGEAVDGRSDLFSLGSVLYILLTGQRAFDAANVPAILAKVAQQDPPLPSALDERLPRLLDYLVGRALAKDPGDRYPDGQSFAEDIEDVLAGQSPRHLAGWIAPERAEGTWVSLTPLEASATPETADLPSEVRPPRGTAPQPRRAAPPADESSLVMRISDRMGRRGFFALGALLAAGIVVALLLPRRPAPEPSPEPSVAAKPSAEPSPQATPRSFLGALFNRDPAHLEVVFEHSLRSGKLKLWVDEDAVLEEDLSSRIIRKIGPVRVRKGVFKKVLDLSPGEHTIKVQVQGDDFSGSSHIKGSFESGGTRRLDVSRGGLLKKDLSLDWL
jgi:serine/threonine protein kinase